MSDHKKVDVVLSFDTTGSMSPCLGQVRREVERVVDRLFADVPLLRIGIIAHGDYYDRSTVYVTKILPLTTKKQDIIRFIREVRSTCGGDAAECYELVLHQSRDLDWRPDANKVLAMIGDDVPHSPEEARRQGGQRIDWREELKALQGMGVMVYGVQALARSHADAFYQELARATGGFRLALHQFFQIVDTIRAIAYKQVDDAKVEDLQQEVKEEGRMDRTLFQLFEVLLGRSPAAAPAAPSKKRSWGTAGHEDLAGGADLRAVNPARFQVLHVDDRCAIRDFVVSQGLNFKKGRGFYEFAKAETIQAYKEVVLRDRATGDMFTGVEARRMIGLPEGATARLKPTALEKYRIFVQSTSVNRALEPGTGFLYEVEDWDRAAA